MLILMRSKDYQGTNPALSVFSNLMGDTLDKLTCDCIQLQRDALQCSLKQTLGLIVHSRNFLAMQVIRFQANHNYKKWKPTGKQSQIHMKF
jgi:hypothetical protein